MLDFAKKSLYVGLGLATMTKDKIEAFAKEAADYAKLGEEEGRKLAEYLQAEARKARESLRENVEGLVNAAVKNLPSKRRIHRLEQRIAALEEAAGITPAAEPDAGDAPCPDDEDADTPAGEDEDTPDKDGAE